ncbi:MAG: PIN domain-containing protein [Akkermansiaceae bacterium]|nr:PIN domain-containing protein [Akkermansiaceae bacterium]
MPNQETPYFLDTNILVYAYDHKYPDKMERARDLIAAEKPWLISWQAVQEFCNVAIHKFTIPLDTAYLSELLDILLIPHCQIYPNASVWQNALRIQSETQYRFYDSQIVAAALHSKASILFSEDLQHGRRFGDLQILNPFLE